MKGAQWRRQGTKQNRDYSDIWKNDNGGVVYLCSPTAIGAARDGRHIEFSVCKYIYARLHFMWKKK
jgi:hypothetical protein